MVRGIVVLILVSGLVTGVWIFSMAWLSKRRIRRVRAEGYEDGCLDIPRRYVMDRDERTAYNQGHLAGQAEATRIDNILREGL